MIKMFAPIDKSFAKAEGESTFANSLEHYLFILRPFGPLRHSPLCRWDSLVIDNS
jgi:hypothetical protein